MRLLIVSDSHGHTVNLTAIVEIAKKGTLNGIVHAGDWNTIEAVDVVLSAGIPLYTVLGNADINAEVNARLKTKSEKFDENYLIVNIGGRKIGITHKPSDNKKYFGDKKLDLIINGHYHSSHESMETSIKTIRPGAIVNGINFAVYDTSDGQVKFVSENE